MSTFLALVRRELGVYFVSPMAYIILTALLFISGFVFTGSVVFCVAGSRPFDYTETVRWTALLNVLVSPLVTMRLIAEEKSRGTIEIVMTSPVTEAQFVLAKFVSALAFLVYLLLPTVGYLAIISQYGEVDAGAAACGYAGVVLMGGLVYSVGLFISSLCTNQITAGVLTFVVALMLFMASMVGGALSRETGWGELVEFVDLNANAFDFFRGVVDLGRLAFFVGGTAFFLFLTTRVVESRRWR